jgi:hypothetical protein
VEAFFAELDVRAVEVRKTPECVKAAHVILLAESRRHQQKQQHQKAGENLKEAACYAAGR